MAETVSTNQFRNGMHISVDGDVWRIVEFQHVKPGKGGAFVRTTLKNVRNGAVVDRTFRGGERVERAMIDKREMQFLYREADEYVFMDTETYDQLNVPPSALGDAANYLVPQATANLAMYDGDQTSGLVGGAGHERGGIDGHQARQVWALEGDGGDGNIHRCGGHIPVGPGG
jgi:elongation factor P